MYCGKGVSINTKFTKCTHELLAVVETLTPALKHKHMVKDTQVGLLLKKIDEK